MNTTVKSVTKKIKNTDVSILRVFFCVVVYIVIIDCRFHKKDKLTRTFFYYYYYYLNSQPGYCI